MSFRIDQRIDWEGSDPESGLEDYMQEVMERFFDSPEGKSRLEADPNMGFWASQVMYYGGTYLGVNLPEMTLGDFKEVLTELFPRKISTTSEDSAADVVPELTAFWNYLGREYNLPRAGTMLKFLREIEPDFPGIMNDPSNFGMAKSFFMAGQSAGFDMTNKAGMDAFMLQYNAQLLQQKTRMPTVERLPSFHNEEFPAFSSVEKSREKQKREKKKRKAAQAARKRNRKRK